LRIAVLLVEWECGWICSIECLGSYVENEHLILSAIVSYNVIKKKILNKKSNLLIINITAKKRKKKRERERPRWVIFVLGTMDWLLAKKKKEERI
jgi:hypothetical protein